eukprot:2037807-Pleurochrysis_carterae.AAC.1
MLRRPSRRCLLRRGAFRRAFEAISAWLRVAIGADMPFERTGGGDGAAVLGTTTCVGPIARRKRAASIEGRTIAKSTEASLNRLSISSRKHAVPKISLGADTSKCLTAPAARPNAGLKSTRDT